MGLGSSTSQTSHPEGEPRYWYRDNFFMTTDKSRLDAKLVNDVFDSDLMWWNTALEPDQMTKMLDNCLTLAVYWVPETEAHMKEHGAPRRQQGQDIQFVGFARLVTDYVTFAYLTDVFVLDDYQRRGLASWMMRAIKDVVDGWPDLRGLMLMTHDEAAARMYKSTLGAVHFDDGPSAGLTVLEMAGRAEKPIPKQH
ncbi:Acetyltransferase (GNAT) family [Geosmithia morbida]|uniref:Acetyltransferase (GNAT) family n=1 Tax=Geosmithia morbida TaxID=1094350 RepID=A0A9P4YW76_9HYPO|nr:Acetyltransferase (GNAT) family [Geosmithia morbida]KAF4122159.1 Acetyltransferase (GNAT) family [Geosmithia morbida]